MRVRMGLGELCAQVLGGRVAGHSRFARRLVAWSVPKNTPSLLLHDALLCKSKVVVLSASCVFGVDA